MKPPANPATVDDYISAFPAEIQRVLQDIRETIRRAAPTARERISYRMPTFALDRDIIHFGAFRGHIGLYPPVREQELQSRALSYRGEKGNLRFPLDQPIPHDLIADIVKARVEKAGGDVVGSGKGAAAIS
jgi:uncharacterized protein YdhG (YjbR/CyaY superfamily)